MKCVLDEVAIFNVVLADEDIQKVMTESLVTMLGVFPSAKLATAWSFVKAQH